MNLNRTGMGDGILINDASFDDFLSPICYDTVPHRLVFEPTLIGVPYAVGRYSGILYFLIDFMDKYGRIHRNVILHPHRGPAYEPSDLSAGEPEIACDGGQERQARKALFWVKLSARGLNPTLHVKFGDLGSSSPRL